ncbi:hypothetical protein ACFYWY_38180, partial [Streptomyces sp. NPDC002870]|uniref:hypothetical protein n=1 Tax=Streptomyces sp. NPDC002870 TaxID=3364666 RepID=UPI0036ADEF57
MTVAQQLLWALTSLSAASPRLSGRVRARFLDHSRTVSRTRPDNLCEAAEKCVYRHRGCLRPMPVQPEEPQEETEPTASSPWP